VTTNNECERARVTMMASLDGETDLQTAPDSRHLATCAACQQWLKDVQSMTGRLEGLSYPSARVDLWPAVEMRIRQPERRLALPQRLWLIGALVLAWRAIQLFVDLPLPALHPFIPLAAAVAAVWLIAGDPMAIETSVPELQKRGA
jgi:predicted anti-sigma-YlaC factor YlaD